jgi:DNA topoisomerase VI subunit B
MSAFMFWCRYLRQIAVITPYARFDFAYTGEDARNSVAVTFARRTDKMPPPPQVALLQHQSIDLMGFPSR